MRRLFKVQAWDLPGARVPLVFWTRAASDDAARCQVRDAMQRLGLPEAYAMHANWMDAGGTWVGDDSPENVVIRRSVLAGLFRFARLFGRCRIFSNDDCGLMLEVADLLGFPHSEIFLGKDLVESAEGA